MTEEPKEGRDFYYDEKGFVVFTEDFLLRRGYCCGNGCRHCPYGNAPSANNDDKDEK